MKIFFLIGLFWSLSMNLYAVDGAELTYKCQGNNTYLVTLKVYLDCTSTIALPTFTNIQYQSSSCSSTNTNISLQQINSYDQNQICPSALSSSTCNGGSLLPSERIYVYQGVVTFPMSCPDWVISWGSHYMNFTTPPYSFPFNRNANITNLSPISNLFIEAGINSTVCYDSPTFESEENVYFKIGNLSPPSIQSYNLGATAPHDCDLTYALTCPQKNNSQSSTNGFCHGFVSGLNPTHPFFGTLDFNTSTGQLTLDPAYGIVQNAATVITVHLLKDGDTIGFVQRDFVIHILNSINFKPLVTDNFNLLQGEYDTLTNSFYLCDGLTNSIFSLDGYNFNGDTVQADLGNTNLDSVFGSGTWTMFTFSSGSYRIDSLQVILQINPVGLPIGEHPFAIGLKTSGCPLNGKAVNGYNLVIGGARASTPTPIICPSVSQLVQLNANTYEPSGIANTGTYNWSQISGPNVTFSDSSISAPTIIAPFLTGNTDSIVLTLEYTSAPYPITNTVCNSIDTLVIHYASSATCRYPKSVEGHVLNDANNNCILDASDTLASNVHLVLFTKGLDSIWVSTDPVTGFFEAHLDTGLYSVTVAPHHNYWEACPMAQSVSIDTSYLLQTLDFVLQANITCPALNVSINAPRLRRCFSNPIYVNYCNVGTIPATNTYIDVELDTALYYINSSLPFSSQSGNVYQFNVGTLGVGQCGSFTITAEVSCSSPLGNIHCMEAHIYPDSICDIDLPNLSIKDTCIIDSVQFLITNLSTPYLSTSYWLLEDSVIVDTGSISINIDSTFLIAYPSTTPHGDYQLLIAPNTADLLIASSIKNCSGILNELPLYTPYSNIPYISSACQANRGSYDPNDKRGLPTGIGNDHYILPNTTIDYRIRFQNTGTDTAIFINILDTLSSNLDVSTLQMGASSHPYTWSLMPHSSLDLDILKITFDPIYLPDSNTNLSGSNGFVNYSIDQKTNLVNFTTIENNASIYFDYNTPIKTNTTLHTICDNCLPINIPSIITNNRHLEKDVFNSIIFPNPTSDLLYIKTTAGLLESISIMNSLGQVLIQQQPPHSMTSINLKHLPPGIYYVIVQNSLSGKETHKMVKILSPK